jgi:hypothetical protein
MTTITITPTIPMPPLREALAAFLFECPSVVDVVLWRYATLRPGYVADFDLSSQ